MSATVRLCLLDPAADADKIVTAAVSVITTTDTAPGDRIMLADGETTATGSSRTRRDRLVEFVLRVGRGATTDPDHRARGDHECTAASGDLPGDPGSGSGLGPRVGDPAKTVANPTDRQPRQQAGSGSDDFESITASWPEHPAGPVHDGRLDTAARPCRHHRRTHAQ